MHGTCLKLMMIIHLKEAQHDVSNWCYLSYYADAYDVNHWSISISVLSVCIDCNYIQLVWLGVINQLDYEEI